MSADHKKPQLEVPEEGLLEHFLEDKPAADIEDQPVLPQRTVPATVNEADWVDQQLAVPLDEDEIEDA